jgi:hypothetical protein
VLEGTAIPFIFTTTTSTRKPTHGIHSTSPHSPCRAKPSNNHQNVSTVSFFRPLQHIPYQVSLSLPQEIDLKTYKNIEKLLISFSPI